MRVKIRIELREPRRGRVFIAGGAACHWFIPWLRDLAVAVGVDYSGAPPLRLLFVASLVIHLGIEPADRRARRIAEVNGVAGVIGELEVVGAETSVDQGELASLG